MTALCLALLLAASARAEKLELRTYYPEAAAVYGSLAVSGKTVLARSSGRVGIGTGNPLSLFHIDGANPALRLEAAGRGPFDLVNLDLAGGKAFALRNPATGLNTLLVDRDGKVGFYTPDLSSAIGALTIDSERPLLIKGRDVGGGPGGYPGLITELYLQPNPVDPVIRSWEIGLHNYSFSIHMNKPDPWALFDISENGHIHIGPYWGYPAPAHKLQFDAAGHLTVGGNWVNLSSRDAKTAIRPVEERRALEAVMDLEPVSFRYKAEPDQPKLGFIADDVPELVARTDRASVGTMDVAAALTSVVKSQRRLIEELRREIERLEREVSRE